MIITIDGPAGSGKSTVAKLLAEKLNFIHFNSGSLYRGITAHLHSNNFNVEQITKDSAIPTLKLSIKMIDGVQHVYVNNIDYTPQLRDNTISTLVPFVGANKFCRVLIDECQRNFCNNNNIVVEGRDVGSHVFPHADVKFYLDCSVKERARRRYLEEKAKNSNVTLKDIEEQIIERDNVDKNRDIAPLIVPENAIIVNSSNLSVAQVVATMQNHIKL